jgi:hypothetical protein
MPPLAEPGAAARPEAVRPREEQEAPQHEPSHNGGAQGLRREADRSPPLVQQDQEPQAPEGERPFSLDVPVAAVRAVGTGRGRGALLLQRMQQGQRGAPPGFPERPEQPPDRDRGPEDRERGPPEFRGPTPGPASALEDLRNRALINRQILNGTRMQVRLLEQEVAQLKDRCHHLGQLGNEHVALLAGIPVELSSLAREFRDGLARQDYQLRALKAQPIPSPPTPPAKKMGPTKNGLRKARQKQKRDVTNRYAYRALDRLAAIPAAYVFIGALCLLGGLNLLPKAEGAFFPYVADNIIVGNADKPERAIIWTMVVSRGAEDHPTWCPKTLHWHQFSRGGLVHRHSPPSRPEGGHAIKVKTERLWDRLEALEKLDPVQTGAIETDHFSVDRPTGKAGTGTLPMSVVYLVRAIQNDDLRPGSRTSPSNLNDTFHQLEWMARSREAMTRALSSATLAKKGYKDYRVRAVHAEERARQTIQWYQLNEAAAREPTAVGLKEAAERLAPGPDDLIGDVEVPKNGRQLPPDIPVASRPTVDAHYDDPPEGPRHRFSFRVTSSGAEPIRLPGTGNESRRKRRSVAGEIEGLPPPSALEFDAYDCSRPNDIQAVTVGKPKKCDQARPPTVVREVNTTYVLLQRAAAVPVTVRRCHLVRSKIPAFCGMHDHSTLLTSDVWIKHPVTLTHLECEKMWQARTVEVVSKEYYGTRKQSFSIHAGASTQVSYTSHGSITLKSNNAQCQGVRWFSQAQQKWVWNVVQAVTDDIILEEDTALVTEDGSMSLTKARARLPAHCLAHTGRCITTTGTYIWNPADNAQCRLYQARRRVQGTEVTIMENGKATTIFNSDDEAIRVIRRDSESICESTVYPTNYDELFLAPDMDELPANFNRPVPSTSVKLSLYFKQQGGWLIGHFTGKLRNYLTTLLQRRCEEEQKAKDTEFQQLSAKQQAAMAGETIMLGDGLFATSSGEAWRRYRCRKVRVVGRNTDLCYDSLPVQASQADLERMQAASRMNTSDLFMTPHTRLLTQMAVEVPCAAHLAPLYKSVGGRWIQATPALLPAPAPTPLEEAPELPALPDIRAEARGIIRGGIYTQKQLEEMENARRFPLQMVKGAENVAKIVQDTFQAGGDGEHGFWRTAMVRGIPELPTLESMAHSALGKIFGVYSDLTQLIVGTYLLWQIFSWVWGVGRRCCFPDQDLPPLLGRLCGSFLPNTTRTGYQAYQRRAERSRRRTEQRVTIEERRVAPDEEKAPLAPPPPPPHEVRAVYPQLQRALSAAVPRRHVRSSSFTTFDQPPTFTEAAASAFKGTTLADATLAAATSAIFRGARDGRRGEGSNVAAAPSGASSTVTAAPPLSSTTTKDEAHLAPSSQV